MLTLSTPVQYIKGVGEQRARILENKGIFTAEDLLYYVPFRYEDRRRLRGPDEVRAGEVATVIGKVLDAGMLPLKRGHLKLFLAEVGEGGHRLHCKWFNAHYLQRIIRPGQYIAFYGKVEEDPYEGGYQMVQPQYEILPELPEGVSAAGQSLEVGRIVPIYEAMSSGRLTSRFFRRAVHYLLETLAAVPDPLPETVQQQERFMPRWEAIRNVHFPPAGTSLQELAEFRSPAHLRLIFEEFFFLQVRLALKRRRDQQIQGIAYHTDARIRECVKRVLPFRPTAAQKKALGEIVQDMRAPHPMHRLLQGDVGSGKTIVALQAAIIAMENGRQVVLMAPTEVLATQHYLYFRRILRPAGYTMALLSGSATDREKKAIKKLLREKAVHLAIGTHALVEEDVQFAALGLAIIDEQHRFGVMQRYRLMQKGSRPDTLVMTATPIPRTLALTLYGDLDVSVIDEMPAGRLPIVTRQMPQEQAATAYEFVRSQAACGAQAFIVYPVIEDGAPLENGEPGAKKRTRAAELKSAIQMYEQLSQEVFPELRVGLLHGRLPAEEKEKTMQAFQAGEIQILVGTTVIEVGIDVPNASVMVVEQAERFGLAQLHQLRGRVGRGRRQSHCLLLTSRNQTEVAQQRLAALERTQDGFQIAELDLRLRGPGEFLGTRQSGIPALRVANLLRDREILEWARHRASEFVKQADPQQLTALVKYLREKWAQGEGLIKVG
ncbi:MAG: ATP-dependent DNA helicase RecG [Acidobacteria bacterium]|nr:ATP-dependent DNA helicase RecG [Acidobacteriota bacterium]